MEPTEEHAQTAVDPHDAEALVGAFGYFTIKPELTEQGLVKIDHTTFASPDLLQPCQQKRVLRIRCGSLCYRDR